MGALKSIEIPAKVGAPVAVMARPGRATPSAGLALPAMYRIHCYLKALVERLQRDGARPRASWPLCGRAGSEEFQQTGHHYLAQGHPPSHVVFRCRLEPLAEAPFTSMSVAVRSLQAALEFSVDRPAGGLCLLVRNFDAPGVRRHFIWAHDVTTTWLDEMSRYVLREPHRFLVQEIPDQLRAALRVRLALDRQPPAGGGPAGLVGWLRQRVFCRPGNLRLQYRGENWTLPPIGGRFLLGRGSACQLVVGDSRVSRVHASIEFCAGVWSLTDCSRNGTRVALADGTRHYLHRATLPLAQPGFLTPGYTADDKMPVRVVFSL
ncbi:MAG: FHA domain-containing protein [Gammaproteobacteria bacterium]|nr:FHA domain-containing protein [Gammaproteobacteria bacterium]